MSRQEHLWHYFLLLLILIGGFLGFVSFPLDASKRFLSLFGAIVGYVLWGVWHHYVEKRLSWVTLSEYLLLALVVLAMASLLVFPF